MAIEALRGYFIPGSAELSASQREALQGWRDRAASGDLEQVALANLREGLSRVSSAGRPQAEQVLEILGPPPREAEEDSSPALSDFSLDSFSLETHFLDDALRPLPRYYTLGVLPEEGLNQSLSSDFALRAGAEARLGPLNMFFQAYTADARPDGNPNAVFRQLGVAVGLTEYSRGIRIAPTEGFYISLLGGMSRVGVGLGAGWCDHIDQGEDPAATCDGESTFQLSAIDESDLLSVGIGPVEIGLRLLPGTVYWNADESAGLPESDRDPFSLRLTYYLNPPQVPQESQDPESVFWRDLTVSEFAFTNTRLFTNFIQNNVRRRQEAAYQRGRYHLALADVLGASRSDDFYGLFNLGTFLNGVLGGLSEGSLAYRLGRDLHRGDTGQQAVLGAMMGLDTLVQLIGVLATPGEPTEEEYRRGEVEGITNLQAQAFRMSLPTVAVRNALAALEALGAFGDRDQTVRDGGIQYFHGAHGALALAGLVMILTSGDFSGDGFFNFSVLGNQLPNEGAIEVTESRFAVESQRLQYFRLEAGTMLLSLGVNAILDAVLARNQYLELRERRSRGGGEGTEGDPPASSSAAGSPLTVGIETDGRTQAMATVGGEF